MKRKLTSGSVRSHIRSIAMPSSIGFFFNTLYNITDTYFAGMLSTEALAALGLSFPVFFVLIALGTGVGTGTTVLVANAIGSGNRKEMRIYSTQSITFSVLVSAALTLLSFFLLEPLFMLLGAEGSYLAVSLDYIRTIFIGAVFFILAFTLNSLLNANGDTRSFRNFLVAGFFANMFLDPALMFGWFGLPAMGIKGIALATVLIQMAGMLYLWRKVSATGIFCRQCARYLAPMGKPFIELARQGFPASLNMMTVALGVFVITYFVSWFGKEAVAAYGIATRIEQLMLLPMIGLNIATLALVGQNRGAGKYARVRDSVRAAVRYGAAVAAAATILMLALARNLMRLFTSDSAVVEAGAGYLLVAAFITWTYVIMYLLVAAMQGLKRPMFAVWIGLYRQVAAPLILFLILIRVFGLGIYGVWFGILAVNWSAAFITIFYFRRMLRKLPALDSHAGQ